MWQTLTTEEKQDIKMNTENTQLWQKFTFDDGVEVSIKYHNTPRDNVESLVCFVPYDLVERE